MTAEVGNHLYAAGDRVFFQGKAATFISLDMPNAVIQVDGSSASSVVSLAALTPGYIPEKPDVASLDDLYIKIAAWPEAMQIDNLPMLSKASVMARLVTAQQLTRIADYLKPRYFVGNGDDLEALIMEELNELARHDIPVKDMELVLARRVARRMASGK